VPTLKEYNVKLARLRSTSKMTRTMKMVAANKLRRAQEAERTAREYRDRMGAALARLAAAGGLVEHPMVTRCERAKTVHVLVISSDRGLCGGFNNTLNRRVAAWRQEQIDRGSDVQMSFCGRRGLLFFRSRSDVRMIYEGVSSRPRCEGAYRIARQLQQGFLAGNCDEVYVAGNRPRGALSQEVVIERLLPVALPAPERAEAGGGPHGASVLLETPAAVLAAPMLERWVGLNLFLALLASSVAEHGARMTAMENSTTNAENLIERYTLLRNRARQAAVTRELLEIIAGAEALG
jgi:F-type H+-transporting ATPase subunit gamma